MSSSVSSVVPLEKQRGKYPGLSRCTTIVGGGKVCVQAHARVIPPPNAGGGAIGKNWAGCRLRWVTSEERLHTLRVTGLGQPITGDRCGAESGRYCIIL